MLIMANQTLQETAETTEPVTLSLGFYTERIKFIVISLQYDVILGKNWKNKQKATIDCYDDHVSFEHAGNKYIIHAEENIKETSLVSLVNGYKNACPIFSVLLRNGNVNHSDCVNKNAEFSAILSENSDVFPEELPKEFPPKRTSEDFEIELKECAKPIKKGLYRMSHSELAAIKKQVEHLIQVEFVRPSKSPWASPVLLVSNKDGIVRLCVEYRALNWFTIKNSYPLPRIDTLMDQIGSAQYFYHQMRIAEKGIPKTAFSTRYGQYEYTAVPFGLTRALAAVMGVMNNVFKYYTDSFFMVYLY